MKVFSGAIRDENLILGLSTVLSTQVYHDWIGRIYGVINPEVENGRYTPDRIADLDGNISQWVEQYLIARIDLIRDYIAEKNLFDLVTYRIKKLRGNNFLVILEPITLPELINYTKKFLVEVTFEVLFAYIIYRILI